MNNTDCRHPFQKITAAWFLLTICCLLPLQAEEPAATTPTETISLFNGKDFSSFDFWLGEHGHTNQFDTFTIVKDGDSDGKAVIRISGDPWGGLVTKQRFANYEMTYDYKWGDETVGTRKEKARNSGVLLHCVGPFGNYTADLKSPWMKSVEFEMMEGGSGDIIMVRGCDKEGGELVRPELSAKVNENDIRWNPDGKKKRFPGTDLKPAGRVWWQHRDAEFEDVLGFRGAKDVEKPIGEWNNVRLVCQGDRLTFFLNGKKVNEATDSTLSAGKILIQSEGAEIFYRDLELHPLK